MTTRKLAAIVRHPMSQEQLSPGTVLAEKYRLESVLGEGGMGTVYRAEHLALKAPVAVKVIDRKVEEGDVTLSRFMREAQSAAALRSPHVVQILDYGTDHGRPFMVMELLEGESLADRLKRQKRLSPEETYQVILHVAKAVSKAHEAEIVHRDLKPDNIFLVHNEGDDIAKVLDFGVAKVEATALSGEGHTRTGSLLGTPYYMSPEQAQGNKDVDGRSDLWALGVIAFECLTGTRPFSSEGLGDLVLQICIRDIPIPSEYGSVPPSFDGWFKKSCEREPEDRFQTARALAEALRSALDLDLGAPPESRWAPNIERVLSSRKPFGGGAEDTTLDESDAPHQRTTPDVDDSPKPHSSSALTSAPNEKTSDQAQSFVNASGPDSWKVVPHGTIEEAPASDQPSEVDPLGETYEPPKSSPVGFVAILAILFGALGVFGLKQLGILELGAQEETDKKPLKVITPQGDSDASRDDNKDPPSSAPKKKKKKKPKSKSKANGGADEDSAKPEEDDSDSKEQLDPEEDSSTEESETGEDDSAKDTSDEASALDALEKEALEAVATAGTPEETTQDEQTDPSIEDETQETSGPKPVLPPELDPPPQDPQEQSSGDPNPETSD